MTRARFLASILRFVVLALLLGSCGEPIAPTLEISPSSATLPAGEEVQLTVVRRFPGGDTDDITKVVRYESSNAGVLGVTETGRLLPGPASGTAVIVARDLTTDTSASASFTVVPARSLAIDLLPSPSLVLAPLDKRQFRATARLGGGGTRDVTKEVEWSSTNESVATVGKTPDDAGLVSAIADGEATIVARDLVSGVEGRTIVLVRSAAPTLVAISVTPNPALVQVASTVAFSALGVYSDGTSKPITQSVVWSSSDEAVLKIDDGGVATGVTAGSASVTAARLDSGIRGSAAAKVQ